MPSWRNWYTHWSQKPGPQGRVGSSPTEGTKHLTHLFIYDTLLS